MHQAFTLLPAALVIFLAAGGEPKAPPAKAPGEVDDALISGAQSREVVDGRIRQVDALRTYARNARLRYEGGYSAYIEVLDAERSLFQSQLSESQALGGGWEAGIGLSAAR